MPTPTGRNTAARGAAREAAGTPLARAETDRLAETFRLLGDGSRLRIALACLTRPLASGDLAAALGLSPSLVSHHLRLLRAAQLVRAERRGRRIYYIAADAHVRDMLLNMVDHMGEDCADDADGSA